MHSLNVFSLDGLIVSQFPWSQFIGTVFTFRACVSLLMEKDYGKLTAEQFRELIQILPELLAMLREMNDRLASTPAAKFDSVMPGDYGFYSYVYELPFIQHLSFVVVGLNRSDEVKVMAASPDPQEAVLEQLRKRDEVDDKPQHPDFDDEDIVTLAYSLGRTMQSMVTYGRSISSLLQDVRENNNHDSLFKAIRMDRAVVGCPTAMKQIARAQIRSNKSFFKQLRSALAGPSQKPMIALEPMRYALLAAMVLGSLVSYMAMHGIDDHNEGMDGLLRALHQHYSTLASKKELSFEEFLAQRVALKAREFNTAVNAPGLTDELKQDAKDAGVEAYRKASRGD